MTARSERTRHAVAAVAVALASCAARDEPAAAPDTLPATIVFRHFPVFGGPEPLSRLLDEFRRENPGLIVEDRLLPASSDQQHQFYATQLEARSSDFDVFALDVVWVPEFARAGWLRDASDLVSEDDRRDFFDGPLLATTLGGKAYAVPWFMDGGLLYYRADLLEKHGLAVPDTLDDLARATRTVIEGERDPSLLGFLFQGRQYEGLVCSALEIVHSVPGGAFVADGRSAMTRPETIEGLCLLRRLVAEGTSPALVSSLDEEGSRLLFGSGRAVFLRNWPYAWSLFEADGSSVKGKVGIAPVPRAAGGRHVATLGGFALGVNRHSRNPEAAEKLVRFLASKESQKSLALAAGCEPTRRSLYDDPDLAEKQPFVARLKTILERAEPRPVTPYYPMIAQALQAELSAVVTGLRSPEVAARRAASQIDHVLSLEEP